RARRSDVAGAISLRTEPDGRGCGSHRRRLLAARAARAGRDAPPGQRRDPRRLGPAQLSGAPRRHHRRRRTLVLNRAPSSLRGAAQRRRSNPGTEGVALDCFVAPLLAMTPFALLHYLFSRVGDVGHAMTATAADSKPAVLGLVPAMPGVADSGQAAPGLMPAGDRPLAILHVFRAPVGGLFRHVVDLVRGQAA